MSPTGIAFAFFLPVALAIYWAMPRRASAQNAVLVLASLVFYASWSPEWIPLLAVTTATDYVLGLVLASASASARARRAALATSLLVNLGTLAWLKYRGFFATSLAAMLGAMGLDVARPALDVVLPLGLSYYTLIRVGYILDVHYGRVPACRSPLTFATFVTFFPQLIAGPITRAGTMLPALEAARRPSIEMLAKAGAALLLGWWMKGYLADWMAPAIVDPTFAAPGVSGPFAHWLALVGFAMQVFCDFAGYSLLAIGVARLFALELPANFDRPFLSRSMPEFWRRWHISLNTWLFDYVYGALVTGAGLLRGRLAAGMIVVFALSGLWHGARWTFVLWGLLHGLVLAAHHKWDEWYRAKCRADRRWVTARRSAWYLAAAWLLTQGWFLASLILFRSPDLGAAADFIGGLFGSGTGLGIDVDEILAVNLAVAIGFVTLHHLEGTERGARWGAAVRRAPAPLVGAAVGLVIAWMLLFAPVARGTFIYAQF